MVPAAGEAGHRKQEQEPPDHTRTVLVAVAATEYLALLLERQ